MSPGLVVYLYLYTAPGLNGRRFGRCMIIVTHVDLGRQDDSDSSWRFAGGGTSQIRSLNDTSHDQLSFDTRRAWLSYLVGEPAADEDTTRVGRAGERA